MDDEATPWADELAAEHVVEWAGLVGIWSFDGASATYEGPQDLGEPPIPTGFGLALSDLTIRSGVVMATVTLPRTTDTGRIVFGYQRSGAGYFSVGIGGETYAYVLDQFVGGRGWSPLWVLGSHENLAANHPYDIGVSVSGQRVTFIAEDIQIFETVLPTPLEGDGVGAVAWGPGGVVFETVHTYKRRPRAFAVMQFGSPFDAMYSDVIKPVCESLGLDVERADDWYRPGVIMDDVIQAITQADLVIAEITPKNPNVYYEVGYAHAAGVLTVLLFEQKEDSRLPFDLSGHRAIFYEDSIGGKGKVERDLHRHVASVLTGT
jgi:hypothetical protein